MPARPARRARSRLLRAAAGALGPAILAAMAVPARAESATGRALAGYVARHDPDSACSEHEALGRSFLHCAHGPRCAPPNLLFEIQGHTVIAVDGQTGDFVDLHADAPVTVAAGRPITYTASDVLLAIGCPD